MIPIAIGANGGSLPILVGDLGTTRRRHGGRVARVRGRLKVDADHNLLAASVNLARLATLGLHYTPTRWAVAAPS